MATSGHNRQPIPQGGRSKNIAPLFAALGAALGGSGSGASTAIGGSGAGSAAAGSAEGEGADEASQSGIDQSNRELNEAGENGNSNSKGSGINNKLVTASSTGQPDYSSLIAKPNWAQRFFNPSSLQAYNQNMVQLASNQMQGQNALATGAQQQQATAALSSQQADQIKQQTLVDAENRVASADGIDVNDPQAMQDWRTQTQHGRALNAGITTAAQGNMATLSKNASDPTQNPMAQLSTILGFNATQGAAAAKFADNSRMTLNPGQTATQSFGPGTPWQTGTGATGSSNTNSKVTTLGANGMPITTDTATTRAGGGGFSNPNLGASGTLLNLGAMAAKANADGTIDDGSSQENDEQVTPAASALQVAPSPSSNLSVFSGGIPNPIGSSLKSDISQMGQGMYQGRAMGGGDMSGIFQSLLNYLRGPNQNIPPQQ